MEDYTLVIEGFVRDVVLPRDAGISMEDRTKICMNQWSCEKLELSRMHQLRCLKFAPDQFQHMVRLYTTACLTPEQTRVVEFFNRLRVRALMELTTHIERLIHIMRSSGQDSPNVGVDILCHSGEAILTATDIPEIPPVVLPRDWKSLYGFIAVMFLASRRVNRM